MVRNAKGYTLTEAMITVAVVGILASASAPLLVQMTNFFRQTSARNAIQRDVRSSLDMINRFTRQGKAGTVVIDRDTNQPPMSRITFLSVTGQTVQFYQSNNKLMMRVGGNKTMLSNNIGYIAFTYPRTDDTSLISVALTAQSRTYKGSIKALQLSIQKVRIMN